MAWDRAGAARRKRSSLSVVDRRRPLIRWIVGLPLSICVSFIGLAMFLEESLIFFPARYPEGQWQPQGLEFEDAWFDASDGVRLHGWFIPHQRPRAVVLFAHGNAGNITHRVDRLRRIHDALRVSILALDYRGYGRSEGRPDEPGVMNDAHAARQWLLQRTGLSADQLVLWGESIGGAVMVDLASAGGAQALVLESTFTSLPEVAAHHYPLLPVRTFMRSRFNSAKVISRYQGPLLMCHGDADSIVPYSLGKALFEKANPPKKFVSLGDHDHNDPLPPKWYDAVDQLLDELSRE